jgi:hypothetical protein
VTFHEVGHAAFDLFNVPIFGHEEDAADNFATFLMLQFGKGQAAAVDQRRRVGLASIFGGLREKPRGANAPSCFRN